MEYVGKKRVYINHLQNVYGAQVELYKDIKGLYTRYKGKRLYFIEVCGILQATTAPFPTGKALGIAY